MSDNADAASSVTKAYTTTTALAKLVVRGAAFASEPRSRNCEIISKSALMVSKELMNMLRISTGSGRARET